MKVEKIIQAKGAEVFAVSPTSTIAEAVDLLGEKNIGAVLVKDDQGRAAGILSERDVVRLMRSRGGDVMSAQVSECMTPNPYTCDPEATVDELLNQMTEKRIRHMPVVNAGSLVGLVSIGDVVKNKIEEAEREAAALKEYISS
ncbi:MAG: CBS domain-containing protein [Pseudomonadota bacterium]